MPQRKRQPFEKMTLNLHPGDVARLQALHPVPGAGPIIRDLVHAYLEGREAEAKLDVERKPQ